MTGSGEPRGDGEQLLDKLPPSPLTSSVAHASATLDLDPDPYEVEIVVEPDRPRQRSRWQEFEDIGLAPLSVTRTAQKLMVAGYRCIGLGILSIIVAVLLGYIATTVFYFLDRTWLTPVAISPSDDKVVSLQAQLDSQLNERGKLVSDLDHAERVIASEQRFQTQFVRALKRDLSNRKLALGRVKELAQTTATTRDQIRATNGDYSESTVSRMDQEYAAGLIDRQAMLAGKFQLAQISNTNMSLAERQVEFDQRTAELADATQSLDALLADKTQTAALSYDVLKIARDYEASKLVLARQLEDRDRLKATIERQDQTIAGLAQSAYLRALSDHATVALVPYANLKNAAKGTPLYACKLSMVMCHRVGEVLEVLPGEVLVKHPKSDDIVRGRMIEMQLTESGAAEDDVLFAGRPPLGF